MNQEYRFLFSTGLDPDYVAPLIKSSQPAANAARVPVRSPLRLTFTEDIQPGDNYRGIVLQSAGLPIESATQISDNEITVSPQQDLPLGADCQVFIPAHAVKDVAGNGLEKEFTLAFTTQSAVSPGAGGGGGGGGGGAPPNNPPPQEPVKEIPAKPDSPEEAVYPTPEDTQPLVVLKDMPAGHWAREEVSYLINRQIINGFPDGTFRPQQAVTRAEISVMLAKALGLSAGPAFPNINDVNPDNWAFSGIAAVNQARLMVGYQDGSFRANRPLTRLELVQVIMAALNYGRTEGYTASIDTLSRFRDRNSIPGWAQDSVAAAVELNLVGGLPGDLFAGEQNATRSQVAVLLSKVLRLRAGGSTNLEMNGEV